MKMPSSIKSYSVTPATFAPDEPSVIHLLVNRKEGSEGAVQSVELSGEFSVEDSIFAAATLIHSAVRRLGHGVPGIPQILQAVSKVLLDLVQRDESFMAVTPDPNAPIQ
jgi:hypothetical protein